MCVCNVIYELYEVLDRWLTCHVEDAVTGADVGQEGISQTLARVGAFYQTSNVNDIKERWDFAATQDVKETVITYLLQDIQNSSALVFLCYNV